MTYRRPRAEECEPGSACTHPASRKGQKLVLWIVTIVVVLAAAFPNFSRFLF